MPEISNILISPNEDYLLAADSQGKVYVFVFSDLIVFIFYFFIMHFY